MCAGAKRKAKRRIYIAKKKLDPHNSTFKFEELFLLALPRRLHALLHLRNITRCHTSERIQRRFMFLLAMSYQFAVRRADRVSRYCRSFIYFTLPESKQPWRSVMSGCGQEARDRTGTSDIVMYPQESHTRAEYAEYRSYEEQKRPPCHRSRSLPVGLDR